MNLQNRKPITNLTQEDFHHFKIWEFATGEEGKVHSSKAADGEISYSMQDEHWVRPVEGNLICRDKRSLIVAAKFWTAFELEFAGLVCVSTFSDIQIGPGALLVGESFIAIPALPPRRSTAYQLGDSFELEAVGTLHAIKQEELRKQTDSPHVPNLNISVEDIFPLRFELAVNIEGELRPRYGMFQTQ